MRHGQQLVRYLLAARNLDVHPECLPPDGQLDVQALPRLGLGAGLDEEAGAGEVQHETAVAPPVEGDRAGSALLAAIRDAARHESLPFR